MIYLPDTNVCIALLRGRTPQLSARWQSVRPDDIAICAVVAYELRYGAECSADPQGENSKLDKFLAPYVCLPFDELCANRCGQLRRQLELASQVIGPNDLQIASIALHNDLTLVTHNAREFGRIDGLKTEDWEA